ncbi:MAG: CarD family transcriptional regulator, partial [Coriobacteriales bacterium]|nr:CarD family transcriptional regulator [Coriobacteriales bacterium]
LAVAQSARPLLIASLWAHDPRPCLLVVAGEEAADRMAHALEAWLGQRTVTRFPERRDWPWSDKPADDAVVGARCSAMERLATGDPCLVVASARALLRRVPPVGSGYYASATFDVGDEVEFADVPRLLVGMGYADTGEVDAPGTFHVHGDTVDVYPAQATSPVRIEFFGDEIDRVRRMVPSTGQTIGELESVRIVPCRELAFTDETVARAERALSRAAREDTAVAADLELITQRANAPQLDRYLPELYGGKTASPLEHLSSNTLLIVAEPRALFDDCLHAADEISHVANTARVSTDKLYTQPKALDFGKQQRVTFSTILRAGAGATTSRARQTTRGTRTTGRAGASSRAGTASRTGAASRAATPGTPGLEVKLPNIAGADSKLLGRVRGLLRDKAAIVFAIPDRAAREHMELRFSDEGIPFAELLSRADEFEQASVGAPELPLEAGIVTFVDAPIPAGVIVPGARLAVFSAADLSSRMAKRQRSKRVDVTNITFPFKPGDYVVHATHGIALFSAIVRQEVAGRERDYFLLEYSGGDKLFVPLEQVDRITRYVGPDGSSPRLTRLNTADWSRVTGKARRSAKKLAFDLVDLYTRRSAVTGFAFSPDTPAQRDMEASFTYEIT